MRRVFVLILLIAAGAGGYYLYKDKDANKFIRDQLDKAMNYPPAQTPEQAANFFLAAIKERDYDKAAAYCTPQYAAQLKLAAVQAKELGTRIDGIRDKMKEFKQINITECRIVLWLLDPFPKDGWSIETTKVTDDVTTKAAATFTLIPSELEGDRQPENPPQGYHPNPNLRNCLIQNMLPARNVKMVREKEGDKVSWKFDFVVSGEISNGVRDLNRAGPDLSKNLHDLSSSINRDAAVKDDFIKSLRDDTINKWAQ